MRLVETRGTWALMPVIIQGVLDGDAVIAVKMIDATDNQPISWAMTDRQCEQLKRIIQCAAKRWV